MTFKALLGLKERTYALKFTKLLASNAINIKKVGEKEFEVEIDLGKCIYCGQCVDSCMKKAIEVTNEFELAVLDREKLKVTFRAKPQEGTGGKA